MCGICGIYSFRDEPVDGELLDRMTLAMRHRGPDGTGRYLAHGIGLGHRRLSIIDLDGGGQPITNERQSLQVVFNGEIYNFIELREELENKGHQFTTNSDTEVIAHGYEEWGPSCVNHFNGMFAFALWDAPARRLFLARDHLGIKPLYYTVQNGRLLFASEIKALLEERACPRQVDIKSLGELFTFRYVPSPNTLFQDIRKIPPGHWLICDADRMEIERYWLWTPQLGGGSRERDLVEGYQTLLEDAIRLQMRSDVPVGLFLSSGIDSNAILAVMSGLTGSPVHAFTIGFEGGERTNETADARLMAARFGADYHEMIVGPQDYADYYEKYLWDIEEPVGNETAAAFYFVSLLAKSQVKVALTGQGADEPWGGYHRHLGAKLSGYYSHLPRFVTAFLLKLAYRLPRNERLKRGVTSLAEPDMLTRFARIYSFYNDRMKEELFQPWVKAEMRGGGYEAKDALQLLQADVRGLDPLTQILYLDTRSNLPDDLLMVNDKTSMANSIETRVPFLDYRLVEFIETLPPGLKINGFQGKYLHKKATEKWLPREQIYRKKKGFANPIDQWFRGKLSGYVNDCLLSESSALGHYFNRPFLQRLVKAHEERREDYLRQIYLLVSFELWHRQFIGGY